MPCRHFSGAWYVYFVTWWLWTSVDTWTVCRLMACGEGPEQARVWKLKRSKMFPPLGKINKNTTRDYHSILWMLKVCVDQWGEGRTSSWKGKLLKVTEYTLNTVTVSIQFRRILSWKMVRVLIFTDKLVSQKEKHIFTLLHTSFSTGLWSVREMGWWMFDPTLILMRFISDTDEEGKT